MYKFSVGKDMKRWYNKRSGSREGSGTCMSRIN
jgi:hypothetical protein